MDDLFSISKKEEPPPAWSRCLALPRPDSLECLYIPLPDIIRVESLDDGICLFYFLHPDTGLPSRIAFNCSISRLETELCRYPQFCYIKGSFILNLDHCTISTHTMQSLRR